MRFYYPNVNMNMNMNIMKTAPYTTAVSYVRTPSKKGADRWMGKQTGI